MSHRFKDQSPLTASAQACHPAARRLLTWRRRVQRRTAEGAEAGATEARALQTRGHAPPRPTPCAPRAPGRRSRAAGSEGQGGGFHKPTADPCSPGSAFTSPCRPHCSLIGASGGEAEVARYPGDRERWRWLPSNGKSARNPWFPGFGRGFNGLQMKLKVEENSEPPTLSLASAFHIPSLPFRGK